MTPAVKKRDSKKEGFTVKSESHTYLNVQADAHNNVGKKGVVIRSVLLKGTLTYRYAHLPEELRELRTVVDEVNSLCRAQSSSLPELAYRFVLAHPAVSTALVGTGRVHELEEIVSLTGRDPLPLELLLELLSDIREISVSPDQLNPGTWPFR